MHLLGHAEKIWWPMDREPAGVDASAGHQESQRGQPFGHPAAVLGRMHMGDTEASEPGGFGADAVNDLRTHKGFVRLEMMHAALPWHGASLIRALTKFPSSFVQAANSGYPCSQLCSPRGHCVDNIPRRAVVLARFGRVPSVPAREEIA
jgi:hypothetical protein